MTDQEILEKYNYDSFTPENFLPWMKFSESPSVGVPAPDFSLWSLDKEEIKLSDLWKQYDFLIVEFGSFN